MAPQLLLASAVENVPPLRALIVAENDVAASLRATLAEASHEGAVTHVERLEHALDRLGDRPDVVVVDLAAPDTHGLDALRRLRTADPDLPIVALAVDHDEARGRHAILQGAQEYLLKGEIDGARLSRAMRCAVDRATAAAALRASERRLRAVFEHAREAMILVDDDGACLDLNPAAAELLGPPREHLIGQPIGALAGRAFAAAWVEFRACGKADGEVLVNALGFTRQIQYSAIGDAVEGRHLWSFRDVTARGRADEIARQRSEAEELARVGRLLTESDDVHEIGRRIAETVMPLFRAKFVRVRMREGDGMRALSALGTGPDHGELMPFGTNVGSRAVSEDRAVWTSDALADPSLELDDRSRAIYAACRERAVLVVPLRTKGRVIGSISIADDAGREFTTREIDLLQTLGDTAALALEKARLLAEVRARYDELVATQQQLTQSQKMEAIGRLAGGVAHDFNNLLTVISGRSELLLAQMPAEDRARSSVDLIARTAERAARVTQQLLAFGRKQILQPRIVDLNAVVERMTALLTRLIGEDIELEFRADERLGRLEADLGQLEQVILNLAVNARDAMPQGGRLVLETANVDVDAAHAARHVGLRPGRHVALVISDTGTGMDAETKARIFEPFFTTKGPGKGTGLGLATVYGIVKQSGGNIWVYSEPGLGTTFRIYFPRVDEALPDGGQSLATADARGVETVLLVEDEDDLRELARDILEGHGYAVLEAGSAADAILVAEGHAGPIHALVTDVVMPRTSGRRLAEHLAPARPEMKVLYMSGYTDDAVVHHGVLAPGTPLLQKPFAPHELTTKLRALLDS